MEFVYSVGATVWNQGIQSRHVQVTSDTDGPGGHSHAKKSSSSSSFGPGAGAPGRPGPEPRAPAPGPQDPGPGPVFEPVFGPNGSTFGIALVCSLTLSGFGLEADLELPAAPYKGVAKSVQD